MKVMYPFDEEEIFDTGINNFKKGDVRWLNESTFYADWVRKKEC